MTELVSMSLSEAFDISLAVLEGNGFSRDHAEAIATVICDAQRDECHSHGLYRLLVCVRTMKTGIVDGKAKPEVFDHAPGIVRVDAKKGYSLLALNAGLSSLMEKARNNGIAAMAIQNCFHFSALWPEVEKLAEAGLAGLAMNPSHSWVAPAGGRAPLLGTNPFAFAWPRPGSEHFVFDFATSAVARGEIELHSRAGTPIPQSVAIDRNGNPTTDPGAALAGAMLPFGGHKGSALSLMIELLAGPLIGDLTSSESKALDGGIDATPMHGELLIAIDPKRFTDEPVRHSERAEALFNAVVAQGARLPSQRRYEARRRTLSTGHVSIPTALYNDICALLA
ncbi:Ldh family oxidoreductase [Ensifer aridi]|uniref:Ldh family oxidoreductase n=1 Tax=Ensifer aridi TaxID=1708715 RepID=UPI000409E11D|nr:Ldh family oxidoreductase [Ensifer aridi]